MKVILINGSSNAEGCTFTALTEVASALNANGVESEIFQLGNKPMQGCIGCGTCFKKGSCVFDDAVNEFLKKAETADGFVFGSPVHFAGPSGAIKSFMDRLFYVSMRGNLAGKPAAAIVSCRRGGSTAALDQLNKYFTISNMPIVSSQYWNMVHGNEPDEVRQDLEGMQVMRTLGNNMAWLIQCINAGKDQNITFPKKEKRVWTNFIR